MDYAIFVYSRFSNDWMVLHNGNKRRAEYLHLLDDSQPITP